MTVERSKLESMCMSLLIPFSPLSFISQCWPKSVILSYETMFRVLTKKRQKFSRVQRTRKRESCDLEIGKRECLLWSFSLLSHRIALFQQEKTPMKKTNLSGQKNWENRASVIQKVWGNSHYFFPLISLLSPLHLRTTPHMGSMQCRGLKALPETCLSGTGNKALETEEHGGNHGEERGGKEIP